MSDAARCMDDARDGRSRDATMLAEAGDRDAVDDAPSDVADDESGDEPNDILGPMAFEEERRQSWKRRSNALLAALRRHHPEHDPRRLVKPGAAKAVQCSALPAVSGPLLPIGNASLRAAHMLIDGADGDRRGGGLEAQVARGGPQRSAFELARIKRVACRHYGLTLNELVSPRRNVRLTRARQVAMYVAKVRTARSLPEIGRQFGHRDHTTVLHALRKIEADLDSYREEIATICAELDVENVPA